MKAKNVVGLAAFCALIWVLSAIHPLDRQAWVLENILVVIFVVVLALTYRCLHLSTTSYLFIALFLLLHMVGAHYTYARMPLGIWARDFFGFSRNHFDRIAHFSFGFFLAFPIRELLVRFSGVRRGWSFWLTAAVVLACSGFFEILESVVAECIAPGKGVDWLGGQGDEWDAQNDMLSSFLGALTMMAGTVLVERARPQK